jgi:hypothetical protein
VHERVLTKEKKKAPVMVLQKERLLAPEKGQRRDAMKAKWMVLWSVLWSEPMEHEWAPVSAKRRV